MQKRIDRLHSVLLSCACLTATGAALSLTSPETGAQVLEEVIVTARKRAEAIQDVPVSVSAFTGSQLRNAGVNNLKDLGLQTPGLQIDQSSAAQIWIRGIGQRDDGSRVDAPVGVYIDGLYIPRKDGQLLDLLDVQSVQVLRGPQGTLFGKNTTAGAIVLTTNGPETEFNGFVDVRLGNFNRQDLKATVNVPLIEETLLSVSSGSLPLYQLIASSNAALKSPLFWSRNFVATVKSSLLSATLGSVLNDLSVGFGSSFNTPRSGICLESSSNFLSAIISL